MNFNFYLQARINKNISIYPKNGNEEFFARYLDFSHCGDSQFILERNEDLIYYTLVYHGILSPTESSLGVFAVTLEVNRAFCLDLATLKELIEKSVLEVLPEEDKLLRGLEGGKLKFLTTDILHYEIAIKELENKLRLALEPWSSSQDYIYINESFAVNPLDRQIPEVKAMEDCSQEELMLAFKQNPFLCLQLKEGTRSSFNPSVHYRKEKKTLSTMIVVLLVSVAILLCLGLFYFLSQDSTKQIQESESVELVKETDSKQAEQEEAEQLAKTLQGYKRSAQKISEQYCAGYQEGVEKDFNLYLREFERTYDALSTIVKRDLSHRELKRKTLGSISKYISNCIIFDEQCLEIDEANTEYKPRITKLKSIRGEVQKLIWSLEDRTKSINKRKSGRRGAPASRKSSKELKEEQLF